MERPSNAAPPTPNQHSSDDHFRRMDERLAQLQASFEKDPEMTTRSFASALSASAPPVKALAGCGDAAAGQAAQTEGGAVIGAAGSGGRQEQRTWGLHRFKAAATRIGISSGAWARRKERLGINAIKDTLVKKTPANMTSEEQGAYVLDLLCYFAYEQEREPLPSNLPTHNQKRELNKKANRRRGQGAQAEGAVN